VLTGSVRYPVTRGVSFVRGTPLNYTDPTGQGMCDEKWADPVDCAEADPDGDGVVLTDSSQTSDDLVDDAIEDGYDQEDINRGFDILNALRGNPDGWWNQYIDWNNPESIVRFILALSFTYETYSLKNDTDFTGKMTVAYSSQFWDLQEKYGNAGVLIYFGTMQTLNNRVRSLFSDIDSLNLRPYLEQVLDSTAVTIMNQTIRSNAPNDPYDFGSCPEGCTYTLGTGSDQAIWLSADNKAYIRSRSQFYSGK
jgi:hypothetical protein